MKGFFKFLVWAAFIGGAIYMVRKLTAASDEDFISNSEPSGAGVLPSEPIKSIDEAPLGGQVSEELLKILVCPEDKGPLELVEGGTFLLNPRNGYRYPIRNGIPVMLIEEGQKYQNGRIHGDQSSNNGAVG